MQKNAGKKKEKCKNCEGKGTLKKGGHDSEEIILATYFLTYL